MAQELLKYGDMKCLIVLASLAVSTAIYAESPESQPASPAAQFVATCLGQGASFNATREFCEGVMVKSRLIQSDALRFLTPLTEKQRETFAMAPTAERFDMMESSVDIPKLVRAVFLEAATEGLVTPVSGGRVAAQLLADIMKPSCGPYQLDTILRTVEVSLQDRNEDQMRPKVRSTKKQPKKSESTACLVSGETSPAESADAIDDLKRCLSTIFQVVQPQSQATSTTLALFPNL